MSGKKQIQHLYRLTAGGYAVYHHTEVIDVPDYSTEYKTSIVHIVILPPLKPEPEPEYIPTGEEVLDSLAGVQVWPDLSDEEAEDRAVDNLPETFAGTLPFWLFLQ